MRVSKTMITAAATVLLLLTACSKPEPAADPVRAVKTIIVAADTAGGTIDFAAEISARTESRLSFRVAGKLQKRLVGLGDKVRSGQMLAQLDSRDLQLGQQQARASLASARASMDQARADFERSAELRGKGFIGAAELERRQNGFKTAQAQFAQAEAQAAVQANQAGYANLVADVAGVVTAVEAEPGMVLAAGSPVLRLAHDGPRDVVFAIPEDKVALIKTLADAGESFGVSLWGGGAPLRARLREISAAADPVTRTYLVKADLGSAADGSVRLGQTATVFVERPRVAGVTKLPLSALKEDQGRSMVWVVDPVGLTVRQQVVAVAGVDGNEAVIASGLNPGLRVVTAGVHVLHDGQKVKLFEENGGKPAVGKPGDPAVAASAVRQ